MRIGIVALLVAPVAAAAAMLFIAIPAGDAIDDSVAVLIGAPAVVSAGVTFAVAYRRTGSSTVAVGWALASAVAAAVFFAILFVALVVTACEIDDSACD